MAKEKIPAGFKWPFKLETPQGEQFSLKAEVVWSAEWPVLVEAHSVGIAASAILVGEVAGYVSTLEFGYHDQVSLHNAATFLAGHFNNSARNVHHFLTLWDAEQSKPA